MKDYVKIKMWIIFLSDVKKYANEFFESFDEAKWVTCVKHVMETEDEQLEIADEHLEIADKISFYMWNSTKS